MSRQVGFSNLSSPRLGAKMCPPNTLLSDSSNSVSITLVRYLASEGVSISVLYGSGQDQSRYDIEFGRTLTWDVDLLGGYSHSFIEASSRASVQSWRDLRLSLTRLLFSRECDVVWVHGGRTSGCEGCDCGGALGAFAGD